jgi:hypothetical protein
MALTASATLFADGGILMRMVLFAVAAAVVVSAPPAYGRTPVPVVNFPDQVVGTASGAKPTAAQVRDAIVKAGASKDWALAMQSEDQFLATRVIKGKHTIVTTISFTAEKYSVTYYSSENMKFQMRDGVPYIHPKYNVWARELVEAIRLEISKL